MKIDYLGAALIAGGVATCWCGSPSAEPFAWGSPTSLCSVRWASLLLVAAVLVERRAEEPIIPLHLFGERTMALASTASVMVGVAMFGARSSSASTSRSRAACARPRPGC